MESWKRKLRMGMVGGGQGSFIGAVHRIAATMDNQVEVVAGCFSREFENTKATGRAIYIDPARCYPTYEAMAAAEAKLPADKRIDFVSIVTPNVAHYGVASTFLKAGFHVVCDKPMTYTLAEAKKLAALVAKSNLVFGVTHNYTGYPLVKHARGLFLDGSMGRVQKVMVEYLQDFFAVSPTGEVSGINAWRFDPAVAGAAGTLGDLATHCFNLVEYITGERITHVAADMRTFAPGRRLDDDSNLLLRLSSGGGGTLSVSQCAIGEENAIRIRVFAQKGSVLWDQENPNYLHVYRYGEPRHTLTRANDKYVSPESRAACRVPKGHTEGFVSAFANVYCDFVRAVRRSLDGKPMRPDEYQFPTVVDGLRGMQFIAASLKSSKSRSKWVKL